MKIFKCDICEKDVEHERDLYTRTYYEKEIDACEECYKILEKCDEDILNKREEIKEKYDKEFRNEVNKIFKKYKINKLVGGNYEKESI